MNNLKFLSISNAEEYLGVDKPINSINPLVSIMVTTYQHEKFISQCLESILEQEVDFDIEIVIGEDNSTDKTREICKEYAIKYQDKIRLHLRDRKHTSLLDEKGVFFKSLNGFFTLQSCRGKYIAICEGDDFWIDKNKLKKQVDILEANSKIGLVYTKVNIKDERINADHNIKKTDDNVIFPIGNVYNDILVDNYFISTLSVMFRSIAYKNAWLELNENFIRWIPGDLPIWLHISHNYEVEMINEITATYRRVSGSVTHSTDVSKLVRFAKSVYNCKWYFINKFDANHNIIRTVDYNYIRQIIYYSFISKNKTILNELIEVKNISTQKRILRIFLFLISSSDIIFHFTSFIHNLWINRKK